MKRSDLDQHSVAFEITSVRVVGADKRAMQVIKEAVFTSFPNAQVHCYKEPAELPPPENGMGGEALFLAGNQVAEGGKLALAPDAAGLPRWPVVALGGESPLPKVETVEADSIEPGRVARALSLAIGRHELLRENARLRGDLLTMAGRITHDLKTPLNGILAAGEAMREVLAERDPAAASLAGGLFNSVEEMVRIMNRVSFMLKASLNPAAMKPVPMGDVVWTVLQRLEGKIRTAGVRVKKPESWPMVNGVEPWLEVIWGNLILNVLEHAGGATELELGWWTEEGRQVFFVRDDGKGVNGRGQAALFRRFDLLHASETGHGLGLAIVQRLVELHGGFTAHEPVASGGSCFSFALPLSCHPGAPAE